MTFEEFDARLKEAMKKTNAFIHEGIAPKVETEVLQFVDNNFRNQSWEGVAWEKTERGGTILVHTGALRRGFMSERTSGQIRVYNDMPYAKVHNEGFDGIQQVRAHTRAVYERKGKMAKIKGRYKVKAHSRHMKIKQRQFLPTNHSPSETLENKISNIIEESIKDLMP